jgi:Tfp pilus assembly protein PilO
MLQVPTPLPPEMFPTLPPWVTLPPGVTLLIVVAIVGGATILLLPLVRALARRLEGRSREDPALRGEMDHVRARLSEIDSLQLRLSEMEERLDFAERMLAQQRDVHRLKGS